MKIIINDIRHFGSYIPKMFFIDMFTTITCIGQVKVDNKI